MTGIFDPDGDGNRHADPVLNCQFGAGKIVGLDRAYFKLDNRSWQAGLVPSPENTIGSINATPSELW
jgi:hypothetical protein